MTYTPRVCLTGGIACGKSLLSAYLRDLGVTLIDADDVAHELIPDPAERRRIAAEVFRDPAKRRALEAKMHPYILKRLEEFHAHPAPGTRHQAPKISVIPLLFELHWDGKYDIICCISSEKSLQLERMMKTRGYSREEAEARLAAQWPLEEKAARSNYVIYNNGSAEALKAEAEKFVRYLKEKNHG